MTILELIAQEMSSPWDRTQDKPSAWLEKQGHAVLAKVLVAVSQTRDEILARAGQA